MLRQLADDLWVTERPLRFGGMEIGTRMTVIRLRDGGLFIHSPVRLDAALREALLQLGTPRFAVAPNRFHHLYAGEYPSAFAELRLFAAPGLARKRPDLAFDGELDSLSPPPWADAIDQECFQGFPFMGEVAFCHRASRTLVLSDLAFNIGPEASRAARVGFRLLGAYNCFGPTLVEKLLISDRAAARASLERILAWDFDRVIVAHGSVLTSGGPDLLRYGYRWL